MRALREIDGIDRQRFREEILPAARPVVLRGLARDWPAVRAESTQGYLAALDRGAPCEMLVAPPDQQGRIFYDGPEMHGLNYVREPATITRLIERLDTAATMDAPPAMAVQSVPVTNLPGFADANRIPLLAPEIAPRLWIGNRIVVATHHDMMDNIAVVVAGRRRFTLFPPDQLPNLYLGPFEFTPNGTPASLVDLDAPDFDRFPRFAEALEHAEQAELAPGDAIYIPYMWWHHVRSRDAFSMLANYWWNETPLPQPGLAPIDALVHALLAVRDLPENQRAAWAAMFSHYVFDDATDHIPEARRGIRGPLSEESKANIRRQLGHLMAR